MSETYGTIVLMDLFTPSEKLGRTFDPSQDTQRLLSATQRVCAVLLDGHPHTTEELRRLGGSSGDRRARQLRSLGLPIHCVRVKGGTFTYQMGPLTETQRETALGVIA